MPKRIEMLQGEQRTYDATESMANFVSKCGNDATIYRGRKMSHILHRTVFLLSWRSADYPIPEHTSPSIFELYSPICDLVLLRGIILQITFGSR